jgi:hypothetical protein
MVPVRITMVTVMDLALTVEYTSTSHSGHRLSESHLLMPFTSPVHYLTFLSNKFGIKTELLSWLMSVPAWSYNLHMMWVDPE